jgi:three-Cys-motif partner protein
LVSHKEDTYTWTKRHVNDLFNYASIWSKDSVAYEKDGVWTVKKLIAISWYIKPFCKIAQNHFKRWNYIDFFSGSGLVKISEKGYINRHLCTGSALLPLYLAKEYKFTDYYFFDKDQDNINELIERIEKLKLELPSDLNIHTPEALSFDISSQKVFEETEINSLSLVVIDPEDILSVRWDLLENLLTSRKIDLILTVMTYALAINHSIALKKPDSKIGKTISDFFGDEHWRKIRNSEELLEYYCNKIRFLGYNVFSIKVHRTGQSKIYDILLATKNQRVSKVFYDLSRKISEVDPQLLKDAIGSNQKESIDLDNYLLNQ